MKTAETILFTVFAVMSVPSLIMIMYFIIARLFRHVAKGKRKKKKLGAERKFSVIISARNEENVIGKILDVISTQNYPADKLRVFVVADNCTDLTAEVARAHGAVVYERTDPEKRTKGAAVTWLFENHYAEMRDFCDAYAMFDADSYIEPDFFKLMNGQLNETGAKIIQAERQPTNPYDNWISAGYALHFWTVAGGVLLSKSRIGLSGSTNGTGFVFLKEVFGETGWNTTAMDESADFSMQQVLKGNKVLMSDKVKVYDEQVSEYRAGCVRGIRWGIGVRQCLGKFFGPFCKKLVTDKKSVWTCLDMLSTLLMAPVLICGLSSTVIGFVWLALMLDNAVLFCEILAAFILALWLGTTLYALLIGGRNGCPPKKFFRHAICYFPFLVNALVIGIISMFTKNAKWVPVTHGKLRGKAKSAEKKRSGEEKSRSGGTDEVAETV